MTTTVSKTKRKPTRTSALGPGPGRPKDNATARLRIAAVMTDGTMNLAVVEKYVRDDGSSDLQTLARLGVEQAAAIASGDLRQLEAMLLSQATALQAMFNSLAVRAHQQNRFDAIQTLTVLALKCAAGSRQSITALAELRTPKSVMFAKQANVTSGPQQVNNGVAQASPASRAEELQDRPNELSGASHELLADTRTSCSAVGADPHMAALDKIDRAEDGRR